MSATLPAVDAASALDERVARLASVRRADWRFLLPEPALGRVAYVGRHDAATVQALRIVSRTVDLLDAAPQSDGDYDVAVLTGAQPAEVAAALRLVHTDGWICAEVAGRRARATVQALDGAGATSVEAWWLWPSAEECRELVPVRRDALRHALGRRDAGKRVRLKVRLAQALAATPLFALAIGDAAVVGRRA